MLDSLLAPLKIKHLFHWTAQAMSLGADLQEDLSFLSALRRFVLPVPGLDREPVVRFESDVFPPRRALSVPALAGKKVGIVATGGGGAMTCAIGVMRACEEAGLEVAGISTCSGSTLALAPVAAGFDAEEAARFVLGWRRDDYLAPDWSQLLKLPLALGRNFTGVIRTEAIERLYESRFGKVTVGELAVPLYANIWDLDHNRLHYLGTRTRPEMTLALLVRAAVTLPLFMRTLEIDGAQCGDGGVVNIFPVDPLVDHHPEIDFFIGINAFYPENFAGEDHSGWDKQTFSILRVSPQTWQSQHLEAARMQLKRIQDRCLMVHPLSYRDFKGIKLYEQFIDRSRWREFITRGHEAARRGLEQLARS
jgi:NTE family protein